MTPAEFKSIRHALGLSANRMARVLGVSGGRTIRKWEAGENDIPGPAKLALAYFARDILGPMADAFPAIKRTIKRH